MNLSLNRLFQETAWKAYLMEMEFHMHLRMFLFCIFYIIIRNDFAF
jgi:hypothetical protein